MPTPTKGPRLGGGPAHERLMLANLAASLFEHKRITTTVTKAKRLKPYAERLVTFAKRGDLITKIGNRKGDNAPMAVIELVLEPVSAKQAVVAEATQAAAKAAPAAEEAPAEEAAVEEAPAAEEAAATEEAPAAEEAATEEAPAAEEAADAPAAEEKEAK